MARTAVLRGWPNRRAPFALLLLILFLAPLAALDGRLDAQENAPPPANPSIDDLRRELADLKAEYERRIGDLERRLAGLASQGSEPTAASSAAESSPQAVAETSAEPSTADGQAAVPESVPVIAEAPAAPAAGSGAPSSNYFNPAISLIGNFLAVGGHGAPGGDPSASLRESELGLQAIIDPYAKADVFLSFGEEGVEVEEGYATFTELPADLLVKVGRMRAAFGKVNTMHLHTLPWPDQPLPIVDLLGGEEGWIGTGASVARLLPIGDTFTEATLQVFRGDADGLYSAERRRDLAYLGHYRLFRDLSDASNLDVGLSYGQGPNGTALGRNTQLSGVDFTYRWKPLVTALYRSATVRGEVIRSRREQDGGAETALGWFLSGDYQFAKRWSAGARLESSEHADASALRDRGAALLLTFSPSEFSELRGELRRRKLELFDGTETTNEFLLQLQFAIGAHGAHPF